LANCQRHKSPVCWKPNQLKRSSLRKHDYFFLFIAFSFLPLSYVFIGCPFITSSCLSPSSSFNAPRIGLSLGSRTAFVLLLLENLSFERDR
jgi:hypothetical protein